MIAFHFQTLPLWITQSPASAAQGGVCAGKIPPNMMLEKRFGIDSILARVSKENLMLPKDYQRLLATIDKAYLGTVPAEDTRRVHGCFRVVLYEKHTTQNFQEIQGDQAGIGLKLG